MTYLEDLGWKKLGCTGETLVLFLWIKFGRATKVDYFYLKICSKVLRFKRKI